MRNWNAISFWFIPSACMFPAYLWGIETDRDRKKGTPQKMVPSLPMRNWNTTLRPSRRPRSRVPSLPMRNWNRCRLRAGKGAGRVPSLPMRNWNPIRLQRWAPWQTRSQPTYEELKRHVCARRYDREWVPSLPMRNWNLCTALNFSVLQLFPAYLWGIETVARRGDHAERLRFPAYLWGIETFAQH